MATHSSTLAWKIPCTEEPGRLQSMQSLRIRHDWATSLSLLCTGEGNGNPLQCSCLENPRDGVAQSRTQLKWLSSKVTNSDRIRTNSKCHTSNQRLLQHFMRTKNFPLWIQKQVIKGGLCDGTSEFLEIPETGRREPLGMAVKSTN